MARLVDARVPLLPVGYRAGLLFCKEYGDWRRAMVLMEDMRVAERRPSGECWVRAGGAQLKHGGAVERRRCPSERALLQWCSIAQSCTVVVAFKRGVATKG